MAENNLPRLETIPRFDIYHRLKLFRNVIHFATKTALHSIRLCLFELGIFKAVTETAINRALPHKPQN
jgi:hypothetical protein